MSRMYDLKDGKILEKLLKELQMYLLLKPFSAAMLMVSYSLKLIQVLWCYLWVFT